LIFWKEGRGRSFWLDRIIPTSHRHCEHAEYRHIVRSLRDPPLVVCLFRSSNAHVSECRLQCQ
jgi:hypothetical protein